jgi:hypothetical protein
MRNMTEPRNGVLENSWYLNTEAPGQFNRNQVSQGTQQFTRQCDLKVRLFKMGLVMIPTVTDFRKKIKQLLNM